MRAARTPMLVSAWCTTRSRNGAAEITRGFGSVIRNVR
jgi:hypothetical protein